MWEKMKVFSLVALTPALVVGAFDCGATCKSEGYCCNENVSISGNQFLSCMQACNLRILGMPQEEVMNICYKPQGQHGNVEVCSYVNQAYGKLIGIPEFIMHL